MTTSKVGSRARDTGNSYNNVGKRFVKLIFSKSVSKPNSARPKNMSCRARETAFVFDGWEIDEKSDILVFITSNSVYAKRYMFS
jgi:hypothetical protein